MIQSTSVKSIRQEDAECAFSEHEIEQFRQSFSNGHKGEVLLGLIGTRRLVTLFLPPRLTEAESIAQMEQASRQLRSLKCDGWLWARPIYISSRFKHDTRVAGPLPAVLLDECYSDDKKGRVRCQRLFRLDQPTAYHRRGEFISDGSAAVLHINVSV